MTNRVQIPAYTDRWMMGDRYGTILGDRPRMVSGRETVRVKLDISGRVFRFFLDDCTPTD